MSGSNDGTLKLWDTGRAKLLATLISLGGGEWMVTTREGRFDTNKSLERIEGLHWVVNDEILKPLPSIADINSVRPKVLIKEVRFAAGSDDAADVTVEVQNVTEDVGYGAAGGAGGRRLSSGAYDLRLFRDGQIVGVSTPPDAANRYNEMSAGLSYQEGTKAWREAKDLRNLKAASLAADGSVVFTFRNIRLPRDGAQEAEISAYAFNADRVKSSTDSKTIPLPPSVWAARKKGRAYLLTIGVNASDNPLYRLRYAANDARRMQEVIGARLRAEVGGRYEEVVLILLRVSFNHFFRRFPRTRSATAEMNRSSSMSEAYGSPLVPRSITARSSPLICVW